MAAEELKELGFRHVVVFEAGHRVGGKCCSVPRPEMRRRAMEGGALFVLPSPCWTRALVRAGVGGDVVSLPPMRLADVATGRTYDPLFAPSRHSAWQKAREVARFADLVGRGRRTQGHAIGPDVPPELARPTGAYLEALGLSFIKETLVPTAAGIELGPLADTVPALYALRYFSLLDRLGRVRQMTLRMPQLVCAHQEPWEAVAAGHDVRLGARVVSVERGRTIEVRTRDGRVTPLDAVFWAAPASELLATVDLDAEEREVFSRVRTVWRAVVFARVRGLDAAVFYVPRHAEGGVPDAHPHAFGAVDPGSDVYAFYPFLADSATSDDALEANIAQTVAAFGGQLVERLPPVLRWRCFPHFEAEDVAAGMHQRLAALDGRRGLHHLGELVAGVGVPHVTEHAVSVVRALAAPT
jgi:hypothetical protein